MKELNKEHINTEWFKEIEWRLWISIYYPDMAEELIKKYCDKDKQSNKTI